MATALKWSIQILWALIGVACAWVIFDWARGVARFGIHPGGGSIGAILFFAAPVLCLLSLYAAGSALLEFPRGIIEPTVAVVLIITFALGFHCYREHFTVSFDYGPVSLLVLAFGAWCLLRLHRLTVRTIDHLLFPASGKR